MRLHYKGGEWFIDDELWTADFAQAICPVEYQMILAELLRQKSLFLGKKSEALLEEAEELERAARIDALCERKWNARD